MFTHNALVAETGKLQSFALRLTKNKSDADDLIQSTCLRALEKADYFQDGSNLFSWTSKIMYNLFVTNYRRKIKFESQYDPEPYLDKQVVNPAQEINMAIQEVRNAMEHMHKNHRDILIFICVEGRSYQETAEMLDIPVGTVRSRLSRAREQLQFALETSKHTAINTSRQIH